MNDMDPLAQLHPLREPAAVGVWPPAVGWWLLALLITLAVLGIAAWWWRRRRRNRYRTLALGQLQDLQNRYSRDGDAAQLQADVNALLKVVALQVYARGEVAALHGASWEAFLSRTCPDRPFAGRTSAHYRREPRETDAEQLCRSAAHWIQRHEVPG